MFVHLDFLHQVIKKGSNVSPHFSFYIAVWYKDQKKNYGLDLGGGSLFTSIA